MLWYSIHTRRSVSIYTNYFIFQAKFLPLVGDTHLVTCARDGQVRLVELGSNGELRSSKKLAQHSGPAHKLATQNESPHVFLSCGEDALVMSLDVRLPKPAKYVFTKRQLFCSFNFSFIVISGYFKSFIRQRALKESSSLFCSFEPTE